MKKAVLIISMLFCLVIAGCTDSSVRTVKNGTLDLDKGITVGQAFDNYKYFKKTTWKSFTTENKRKIVEVTGEVDQSKINNPNLASKVEVVTQFNLNTDDTFDIKSFGLRSIDASGEKKELSETNPLVVTTFLKNIYNNDPLVGPNPRQGASASDEAQSDRAAAVPRMEKGRLVRLAVTSEVELEAWLKASNKTGAQRELREADTNGDGIIGNDDLTNEELRKAGVCKQWVVAAQGAGFAERWSLQEEPGKIACIQSSDHTVDIIATGVSGDTLYRKTLSQE